VNPARVVSLGSVASVESQDDLSRESRAGQDNLDWMEGRVLKVTTGRPDGQDDLDWRALREAKASLDCPAGQDGPGWTDWTDRRESQDGWDWMDRTV